ncbi:MAG: hypothetical protein HY903_01615 [Deltaproteobacteria bacterium]|nr:hypothetical protein [Deltaproteobacteria bacterium]
MSRRRLALPVLCLIAAAAVLSFFARDSVDAAVATPGAADASDPGCPDPDTHGRPCGPSCPCACCPGHMVRVALLPGVPTMGAPTATALDTIVVTRCTPVDVLQRIFHPPRA